MTLSFPPFTPAVKQLMIANGAIFLLFAVLGAFAPTVAFIGEKILQLRGIDVVHGLIWQRVTHAFLHAGVMHILFNLLALWMFGAQLEMDWGYSLFMRFYFFCVIGAALVTVAVSFTGLLGVSPYTATVGASGGIYGLLLAFGILHGDAEIMLFPLPFLIKAKYFVIGIHRARALWGRCRPRTAEDNPSPTWPILAARSSDTSSSSSCPGAGFGFATLGALVRLPQLLLPLEAQARRAQVRGVHAQARPRRLPPRGLL